jgi:amino acid adenylation domain-containing protein
MKTRNEPAALAFPPLLLHELFEEQAARTPQAPALIAGTLHLTYEELRARANRLAWHLIGLGVGPEVRVGICIERSADMLVAMLAALQAGGAYVPLDPAYPRERLAAMLEDSGARVLIAGTALPEGLAERTAAQVVRLDGLDLSAFSTEAPPRTASPGNLAYLIYTSGSTGRPKGVAIEHRSAVAFVAWARTAFPAAELAGVLASTSICFDLSVFELFVPLAVGGTVILAANALELPALPEAGRVTLVNTVPSAMAELVRTGGVPASVQVVNLAGEPLSGKLVEDIYRTTAVRRVLNLYGPSEDTTYSTGAEMPREEGLTPTIGRPITGTQAYVVDPEGEIGELLLGGAGLARGYLGRPELTAASFVPDAWSGEPGARLYRTGDLVRPLPDGNLAFLGRRDHQVKIRGFRIELGEIEAALARHRAVRENAVIALDEAGTKRLVACLAFHETVPAPDALELRTFLGRTLPEFMIPSAFVRLATLPLSLNGKIDRRALQQLAAAPDAGLGSAPFVAPRTSVEEELATLWAEALGIDRMGRVGMNDHFFALGGHSLLAGRLLARVRDRFGAELSMRDLFAAPVLSAFAERVASAGRPEEMPPLLPLERRGPLPLSFVQQSLWLVERLHPAGPAYNIPALLTLSGPLHPSSLAAGFGALVRRHEALRTRFVEVAGEPFQEIAEPPATFELPLIDLGALPEAVRQTELERLVKSEARRPFSLTGEPLLRAFLARLEMEEHALFLNQHHAISDGWSLDLLVRDLAALCSGDALPELPLQYADYAAWQRQWLCGEALTARLDPWRQRLAGVPALELPTDFPRPVVWSFRGGVRSRALEPELVSALQGLSRGADATPFMVLLAVFQALLGRYAGQDDFAVGAPSANRGRTETENLAGYFVNMIALRAKLSGGPGGLTFRQLLDRVRDTALDAYAHQDLPFERVVEELAPERDLSRNPVFQAVFQVVAAPPAPRFPGLSARLRELDNGTAKFDLGWKVEESAAGWTLQCEHAADLFSGATVQRMLEHFAALLGRVAASPDVPVADLPLESAAERHQLLCEWNDTAAPFPVAALVHELVAMQARRASEAPAVVWSGGTLTYGDLDRRADRLARVLRSLGVGPEVRVGVCLERSPELIVANLAVLKAGGAYVALDPGHPEERLAFQLEDSQVRVLFARPGRAAELAAERGICCLAPDTAAESWLRLPGEATGCSQSPKERAGQTQPGREAIPDNLAYVIYTSGSTGRPKGVEVTHRSLLNLIALHIRRFDVTPADRTSLVAAVGFDASVWEIWPYLAAGASLHVVPESVRTAAEGLRDWLVAQRITLSWLPVLITEGIMTLDWPAETALRCLLTGGDRLHQRPPAGLPFALNLSYGPTESTVISTQADVPAESRDGRAPTIGRPLANLHVAVIDRGLRMVPAGVPGELLVGGAGLARGYLRRPGLTAERFVPDPWSREPGARLYRTGDLVRLLADGEVEFLGRIDHQVKIRGYRIELGEIEAALMQHPEVQDAAVLARNGSLVAYVTERHPEGESRAGRIWAGARSVHPDPSARPSLQDDSGNLTAFLRSRLPEYMIPSAFVALPEMPLNASGKIDRGALARIAPAAASKEQAAPRNPVEELIAGIWEEVLEQAPIGVHDNFFHLGGHSLLATRALSRVRDAFGVDLPLQSLFADPTVSGLARAVAEARGAVSGSGAVPPLRPVPRDGSLLPLSFPQQRLWFMDRLAPDGATYNIPSAFRLRGPLDHAALAVSLSEIVRRHEALRTRFVEVDGRPWQEVLPAEPFGFSLMRLIDLRPLAAEGRTAELARLGHEEARRPFDLRQAPLLRAALVRLAGEEHALLLNVHHIVSDGWSEEILLRELSAIYAALRAGRPSPLREPAVQYADFAAWQRAWPDEVLDGQLAWWTEALAGLATLEVPTDRARPPVQTFRGGVVPVAVPPAVAAALRALARERRATLFMLLLGAWQTLFHRVTGQTDVAVGSPVANRNRPEIEGLIGFFVNMLPLRTGFDGGPAFDAVLDRVRRIALAAYDHADVPFERLVDELHLERDLSRQPLVQVMFVLQNAGAENLLLPGVDAERLDLAGAVAKFDLTLSITDEGAETGFSGWIEYNADLFDRATAHRLGGHFGRVLAVVTERPGAPVAEIELLTAAERHQILREWSDTAAPFPETTLVHQFFEARIDAAPAALAAVWEGRSLTYGELEARANRIAGLLLGSGLERGLPVGVWMERSLDVLAAVLGVLKAGGHYVPLDPSWPAERVETILGTCGAPMILTRSAHLGPLLEMQWRLPALTDVICLDADTPVPAPERVDEESVRAVFDLVAERAVDRETAGGFVSSFTGEAFSAAEVDEYRDRVLALAEPWLQAGKRVLEIGSGSGLLLWEIAPRVAQCAGLDPSPLTQETNRARAAELGLTNVELPVGFAHEIESWPEGSFDLVILASTVQFFPGPLYLRHTVEHSLRLLAPGGGLVIADVPDARRQAELRRAVEEHRGRAGLPPRQDPPKILSLDEDLFRDLATSLPAEVSVLHRRTGFANELGFRYDVVVTNRPGEEAYPPSQPRALPWAKESRPVGPEKAPGNADGVFRGAVGPKARASLAQGNALGWEGGASKSGPRKNLWTAWHVDRCAAVRPAAVAAPEDLAYVIHTSGSTGRPKGINVQHRPVANLIAWINGALGIGPADRVLFVTSLCFDLSVWDVFGVLAAGGCVHVASEEELRDAERLVRILLDEPVTIWDSAPAALVRLAPLFPSAPAVSSRLRRVMLSGDWIPVTLPDRVRAAFPRAEVTGLGGATEATVWSNGYPVGAVDPSWPSIPYGRPMPNARYQVLDAGLRPCPLGVPGNLYIGGDCLCVGYAHQPALTAAAFLPDPFAGDPNSGSRLYRTGDRARWLADGNLEFLGRIDQQVKIRGFRIELGEIEVALAQHPRVREAVAMAREDVPGDKRLVAYVVPAAPGALHPSELRDFLRRSLPDYMIPAAFVELQALPVTSNGKLDRRALPAPRWDRAAPGRENEEAAGTAPRTATEKTLAALWRDLLGVERVSAGDSFFELGGHSLLATQLVARVREAFGIEMPLRAVFQAPSLAEMAAWIDGSLAPDLEGVPALRRIPRTGLLPLSASQLRQWFLVQLEPESVDFNLPVTLRLTGTLDVPSLAAALREIVRRHEALRTTFAAVGGRPAASVAPHADLPLPIVDLRPLPAAARETEIRRLTAAESDRPFDLTAGPLLRTVLLRAAVDDHVLAATVHHIAFDGFSLGVFLNELAALYEAFAAGRPSPLPEVPLQYADYAAWQQEQAESPAVQAQVERWRERLAGSSKVLELPTDRPRPAVQSHRGELVPVSVPAGVVADLKKLAGREGATLFMILLSGYAALLSRYTGQDDLNIGTYVANRRHKALESLIGFFVNTLVLRVDLSGGPTFRELLGRVLEMTLDAFEDQEVPIERLLDELETGRDLSRTPLFQVQFGVQSFAMPTVEVPGLTLRPVYLTAHTRTQSDLAFWMWEEGDGLTGWLQLSTDLFDAATVARMFGHMTQLLAAGAADPGLRLAELPLMPASEQEQILRTWGMGAPHRQALLPVHERMRRQARRTPDADAVVTADGRTLTYADLDRRAGQVARGLRSFGAGPETVIGICLDRSPEMIVALYGILGVGAAYLPLDPKLPRERLAALLADAGAPFVLTRRGLADALPELPVRLLFVDSDFDCESGDGLPEAVDLQPQNAAYVLYTSGSTGTPKGVVIEHRALASFVEAAIQIYEIGPDDRVLQFAALSFDTSAEEIYPCLAVGGTLVLRSEEMLASPATFLATCESLGITVLDLPTAYWHELAVLFSPLPGTGRGELGEGPGVRAALRLVILGGERALPERVKGWLETVGPWPRLVNTYGPTEGTVVATTCDLGDWGGAVPIGRPIPGGQVCLLDRELRPVPTGVPGEICLDGAGLARGYLGRPDLTAERFVPSPFGGPGERLYRTGDLARWLPGGTLDFVGRIDDQLKIRGFRVEPGEIAATLARHPAVREAAVLAREVTPGDRRLTAYAVPAVPADLWPAAAELRAFLKESLPAYMVPADVVLLEAMPLTRTGKIDRKALAAVTVAAGAEDGTWAAPETATEELLAEVWSQLLGANRVGLYDNFFDLGGHSLLVPQLIARIGDLFGVELPMRLLFAAPTVAEMAAAIDDELLAQIEELSDDEAESLISEELGRL